MLLNKHNASSSGLEKRLSRSFACIQFFNIFTFDQQTTLKTKVADHVDDKVIISIHENSEIISENL